MKEREKREEIALRGKESAFSAMKKRVNLQTVAALIRDGSGDIIVQSGNFEARREEAFLHLQKALEPYGRARETILEDFLEYTGVIEEIYFNLGMKAGAMLYRELTENFEGDI